jgi:hypothetical protein
MCVILPLQEVIAAAQGALGSIHIGEAERGVLQTIWLLLSSVICVPAVVKLIPGGSPVLGYLVSRQPGQGQEGGGGRTHW